MLLLLVFFVCGIALTVLLWVGSLFFQGYIYTEPSPELYWQAPTAGFALALFFTMWTWLVQSTATPREMPYDTLFRFSPQVDKYKRPTPRIWVVRKDVKDPIPYTRHRIGQNQYEYKNGQQRYSPANVKALLVEEENGDKLRLEPAAAREGSPYREFVDPKSGWTMMEYEDGPTGQLISYRFGLFAVNIILNLLHLAVWFVCLWLLLRFTWGHALGFAFVLWLIVTLTVLPMVLSEAAADGARTRTAAARVRPELALQSEHVRLRRGSGNLTAALCWQDWRSLFDSHAVRNEDRLPRSRC